MFFLPNCPKQGWNSKSCANSFSFEKTVLIFKESFWTMTLTVVIFHTKAENSIDLFEDAFYNTKDFIFMDYIIWKEWQTPLWNKNRFRLSTNFVWIIFKNSNALLHMYVSLKSISSSTLWFLPQINMFSFLSLLVMVTYYHWHMYLPYSYMHVLRGNNLALNIDDCPKNCYKTNTKASKGM